MFSPDSDGPSITRRHLMLGATAAGATFSSPVAADTLDSGGELGVMTQNLYVGVDLFRLFSARDIDDVRTIAGELFADIQQHPFEERMGAVATAIAAREPAVIGLQEGVLIRTRRPSEFDGTHDPGASDVVVDLLALLEKQLAELGSDYEIATSTVTSDIEVPADIDDETVDVRLTDRVAVLVRGDVAVTESRGGTFEAGLEIPFADAGVRIQRGHSSVDITVGGETVTVATAHLESVAADVRREQAEELQQSLPADRPVVLAGDINSSPDSEVYEQLRARFQDAHDTVRPDVDGFTCCHDADLRNEEPGLSDRIDHILYGGDIAPVVTDRFGADPSERVMADIGDETARIWPSDHAGVTAEFTLSDSTTPTPTATDTPTPTATDTPTPTATDDTSPSTSSPEEPESQSGMGLFVSAVAAFLVALQRASSRARNETE